MKPPDWIAVDWGTTRLRAWAMSASAQVLAQAESGQGMASLAQPDYEPALMTLVEPWLAEAMEQAPGVPVIACGMVGSQQGWIEAPYASVPCRPGTALTEAPTASGRIRVLICPGVKQDDPADVMRGEETQIAGLLAERPDFEGVVCLPGTHSKWVRIGTGGEIEGFQTFLTGEMYGLLAEKSVLRHTVAGDGWHDGAFLEAVDLAMREPAGVAAKLFSLRAEALLRDLDGSVARARLSGYLIGQELGAAQSFWRDSEVAIVGAPQLSRSYQRALQARGVGIHLCDAEAMTIAGLCAAWRQAG